MTRYIVSFFVAASLLLATACSSVDRSEWCEEQCQNSSKPEACYSQCIMGPEHGLTSDDQEEP